MELRFSDSGVHLRCAFQAGEMALWAAFPGDPGSTFNTHMAAHNCLPLRCLGTSDTFSGLFRHQALTQCTNILTGKTHIHKINTIKKEIKFTFQGLIHMHTFRL